MKLPPLVRRKDIEYAPRRVAWFTAGGNGRDGYQLDIKIGGSPKSVEAFARKLAAMDVVIGALRAAGEKFESYAEHCREFGWDSTSEEFDRFAREAKFTLAMLDAPATMADESEPE